MMLVLTTLAFLTGILNRIADMVADDGLNLNKYLACGIGILYGFLIAHVITAYPVLAELGMAVMLSVIMAGKIDHPVHQLGIASLLFLLLVNGIAPINLVLLVIFIFGAALDEAGNCLADKKKVSGILGAFFRYRLTMEVITFAISFFTGSWIIFIAMVSYDAGFTYIFPARARRKLISICGQG